jgi:hypothetical protein
MSSTLQEDRRYHDLKDLRFEDGGQANRQQNTTQNLLQFLQRLSKENICQVGKLLSDR